MKEYFFFLQTISVLIFEPVFFGGLIGGCIAFFMNRQKRDSLFWGIFAGIIFMVCWRTLNAPKMISKRYSEILILPWTLFLAYACVRSGEFFERIAGILKKEPSLRFHLFCRWIPILFIFAETILLVTKITREDVHHANIARLYQLCGNGDESRQVKIYTNSGDEINRIKYYSKASDGAVVELSAKDSYDWESLVADVIPDFFYQRTTVYFLMEDEAGKRIQKRNLNIPSGYGTWNEVAANYTSRKKKKEVVLYRFDSTYLDTITDSPLNLEGSHVLKIKDDEIAAEGKSRPEKDCYEISGEKSILQTKKYLEVPEKNRIDMRVNVANVGTTATKIYFGYAFYDKNKHFIGSDAYPYRNINKTLKVISAKAGENSILVDRMPKEWAVSCSIAVHAKEDLSDVPNPNIAGKIMDVKELENGQAEIILEKNLETELPPETLIRIHAVSGAYLYTEVQNLNPGENLTFSSTIAKFESHHRYTKAAISSGICFVRPLILSYSLNSEEENTVEIRNWQVVY